jgi:hypothetical protein
VNRAAEECAAAVANAIVPEQCINILNPFIDTAEFPINLAAIKMQIKVVESVSDKEIIKQLLPELTPRLLKVLFGLHLLLFSTFIINFSKFVLAVLTLKAQWRGV